MARYGLNVSDVRDVLESAVSGHMVGEIIEGQKRFDIVVRLPAYYRQSREALGSLQIIAHGGELISLDQVARIVQLQAPEIIQREDGQRRIVVQSNVRGRDLGSFVAEAQRLIAGQVSLPPG
jgi:cobalt-zinc-cadmium resistance protein CzcA